MILDSLSLPKTVVDKVLKLAIKVELSTNQSFRTNRSESTLALIRYAATCSLAPVQLAFREFCEEVRRSGLVDFFNNRDIPVHRTEGFQKQYRGNAVDSSLSPSSRESLDSKDVGVNLLVKQQTRVYRGLVYTVAD